MVRVRASPPNVDAGSAYLILIRCAAIPNTTPNPASNRSMVPTSYCAFLPPFHNNTMSNLIVVRLEVCQLLPQQQKRRQKELLRQQQLRYRRRFLQLLLQRNLVEQSTQNQSCTILSKVFRLTLCHGETFSTGENSPVCMIMCTILTVNRNVSTTMNHVTVYALTMLSLKQPPPNEYIELIEVVLSQLCVELQEFKYQMNRFSNLQEQNKLLYTGGMLSADGSTVVAPSKLKTTTPSLWTTPFPSPKRLGRK